MEGKRLSLADVGRYPRTGMATPRHVRFTPDGRAVSYLAGTDASLVQSLWTYDIATGERRRIGVVGSGAAPRVSEGALSLDEQLRRERTRTRELGVTDYQFVQATGGGEGGNGQDDLVLLAPLDGGLYVARGDGPLTRLAGCDGARDARLSPDGTRVAFVRDVELHVAPARGSAPPWRLTSGAGDGVTNGVAEYIAQEEMGRHEGYWWSPDGARLAYVQADSSHILLYPIAHQGAETVAVEEHRYPFAGARNATVRLGVVAVSGDGDDNPPEPATWMDLGGDDIYLARVAWRPDGTLTAQIEARDQQSLRLVLFDPQTGAATTLIEERGKPWLNLGDETCFLRSGEIIWPSESTGFRHLYLHDADGRQLRALTEGPWVVTGLAAVDEDKRVAYFHGAKDSVLERHLYAVSLDGGPVRRVTEGAGWHSAVVAPDIRLFVDTWSAREQPPTVTLRRLDDGAEEAVLFANEGAATVVTNLGLCVPELTLFRNRDGVELHASVYASEETRAAGRPAPLIVSVYGGPHAQRVAEQWDLTVDLRAQYLAQQGFVVLKVDNRGSANRGLAFEAALARDLGHVEVDDQVDGVRFLSARAWVDGDRVGIYGWSYGGYMTCMALLRAPHVFKAGVAGAPVTDWRGYDTHYTERYMGLPASNEEGYRMSAVMAHVERLRGKLLLVHGMVDENVHFRHTARLIAALTAAGKPYDLVVFPEERHMPRDAQGLEYQERRLADYFRSHL